MLTATITNTSGATTLGTTWLPGMLSWVPGVANSAAATAVLMVSDLLQVVNGNSGFTLGQLLQQMVQAGLITITYANLGATDREITDKAVSVAA